MRCEEIMKKDVECLSESDSVHVAAQKMRDREVGFLPICDAQKRVVGTLTDRDIVLRVCADDRAHSTSVADVMTRQVVACRPSDDLRKAHDLMSQHQKSRLLVTDESRGLLGVISLSDLVEREEPQVAARTARAVARRETKRAS